MSASKYAWSVYEEIPSIFCTFTNKHVMNGKHMHTSIESQFPNSKTVGLNTWILTFFDTRLCLLVTDKSTAWLNKDSSNISSNLEQMFTSLPNQMQEIYRDQQGTYIVSIADVSHTKACGDTANTYDNLCKHKHDERFRKACISWNKP